MIKEMVYSHLREKEILMEDVYKDIPFVIISYGLWPCCYFQISTEEPKADIDIDDFHGLDVHGGVTLAGNLPGYKGTWIGWDYAHCGDFDVFTKDGDEWFIKDLINETLTGIDDYLKTF